MTDTALAYLPSYRILNPGDFYNEGEGLHGTKKKTRKPCEKQKGVEGGSQSQAPLSALPFYSG